MNPRQQRRVLYREFLFRIVDRELLSVHSTGDASQLLLQIVTLLVGLSGLFSIPALFIDPGPTPQAQLMLAWNATHFLIATTMLTVGVFTVLGWGSLFPDQRDILVLAPLPVHPHTILAAKIAAIGTAMAVMVVALHAASGVVWPLMMNRASSPYTIPALTAEAALPPVDAAGLKAVLDLDFERAVGEGALASGAGGGVAIGVSTHGTRRVLAYGAAGPDSIFPIASVTKPFTGLALAAMIERGAVRADEPIRLLIPRAGLPRPTRGRPDITPLDLATHRSGLPAMPPGFRPHDPANPFADFEVATLYAFLTQRGVERPFGARFEYSNLGFGLLGHALANRAGTDYATLIGQFVTQPLDMTDTVVTMTTEQRRRLLPGHDREHRPVRDWNLGPAIEGAGALKSTAPDLLTFLEANLRPDRLASAELARAIRTSHQRQGAAGEGGVAFAWFLSPAGEFVHSGDMAGYSAQVWFRPATETALVVLANTVRGTSVSADVIAEHVRARLDGLPPIAITDLTIPGRGGALSWLQLFVAYWLTMAAAGLFVFGIAAGVQGIAAGLLPHRLFLRISPVMQLGLFGVVIAGYFLPPLIVTPSTIAEAQRASALLSPPSYWFLGLFQALSGSPLLAPLAGRAVAALIVAAGLMAAAGALSSVRTLRRLVEEPDFTPAVRVARYLPPAGAALPTAVVQFSARTLLRSAPHRVLYTFYLGIGFALAAVFLKTPRAQAIADGTAPSAWDDTSVPMVVSSVVMMVCAVVGARLTFAMPRDLAANWIFRVLPLRGGPRFAAGRRRAFYALAAGPVWLVCTAVFLARWPLAAAVGHVIVLALLGAILVELCLWGTQKLPFTCAYLPGQTRSHVTAPLAVVMLFVLAMVGAEAELEALRSGRLPLAVGALALLWVGARWRTATQARAAQPEFEDEPAERLHTVELWDSRF